jgi:hypothetical protein
LIEELMHIDGHFLLSVSLKKLALLPSSGETVQPNQLGLRLAYPVEPTDQVA